MEAPLPRVQETMNTNKNINYPPILPPKLPSTMVTNIYTEEAASKVYGRIEQYIEYPKEKYGKTNRVNNTENFL